MQKERESGLELLRIFCMFGIISMHTFGSFLDTCTGSNMVYGCVINSVFNMGVSIFALITGFFGNCGSQKKIMKMWLIVMQYSFLRLGVNIICKDIDINNISDIKNIICCFFPVFTGKYWFLSCYMVLMILAKPINLFINTMEKKQFKKFLLSSLFIFSFMPTLLLGLSITKDRGKGLVNFLLVFFIGRFINKYYSNLKIPRYILGGGNKRNYRYRNCFKFNYQSDKKCWTWFICSIWSRSFNVYYLRKYMYIHAF